MWRKSYSRKRLGDILQTIIQDLLLRDETDVFSKDNEFNSENRDSYLSPDTSGIIHREISLEEAVRDERGNLTVYGYSSRRKKSNN